MISSLYVLDKLYITTCITSGRACVSIKVVYFSCSISKPCTPHFGVQRMFRCLVFRAPVHVYTYACTFTSNSPVLPDLVSLILNLKHGALGSKCLPGNSPILSLCRLKLDTTLRLLTFEIEITNTDSDIFFISLQMSRPVVAQ